LLCIGEQVFVVCIDGKPGDIDAADAYADGLVKSPATAASTDGAAKAQGGGRPATMRPIAGGDADDSSVADFDFLDDGDLDDKQPKL